MTKPGKIHPAAEIFPLMSEDEYVGLKEDIKANKQQEPICYWRGELLDGRNRLKACHELGIKIDSWELDKDADLIEKMTERMAIMEYDGGLTRSEAEKRCYAALVAWCKRVGRTVPIFNGGGL